VNLRLRSLPTRHIASSGHLRHKSYRTVRSQDADSCRRPRRCVFEHEPGLDEEEESVGEYAIIRLRWSENPEGIEWRVRSAVTEGEDLAWLDFKNEEGEDDFMAVRQDSVLGELQQLASSLIERFPWGETQTTWFILTGEPPLVPPVKVRYTSRPVHVHLKSSDNTERFTYGEVTISAAPWVSEDIVADAYFNLQRRILPGEQNRPLERRRIELLRFVLQRENPLELTKTRRGQIGKELVKEWDRKNPNWAYGNKALPTSTFWDAFNDIEELVLQPSWTHPRKVSQSGEAESSSA
jgi:hypothetical protein